jgi:hypothetical protein
VDDHIAGEAGLCRVVGRRLGGEQQRQRCASRQYSYDGKQQERPVLPGGWGAIFAWGRFDEDILLPDPGRWDPSSALCTELRRTP